MIDTIDGITPEERLYRVPLSERGPAPSRVVASYGFWLFLLSDIIIFAALFAAYAVLSAHTDGGPGGAQLFNRAHVLIETSCLLVSSFTCGIMVLHGAGPSRSAFLSAFFALVGTHGLHVTLGIAWLIAMMAQVATLGFRPMVMNRMLCFSLFWHALDIVWIGVFTIVYLGVHP
jgi:cytochrome o ubiquinol oxidase subunit 3